VVPGGRPKKQPDEQRSASTRADLTLAEKEALGHEVHLHGISEAEYVRRRLGFGPAIAGTHTPSSLVSAIQQRGVDVAELFSRDYIQQQAEEAGMSEAALVRHMLQFAASPPAKLQTAALISELNRLGLELKSIGNNANQIALNKHTGRQERLAWELVVETINERCAQLDDALEKVLETDD